MNEITIAINYDNDNPTISGRELHEALGIKSIYVNWFSRMCEYGFTKVWTIFHFWKIGLTVSQANQEPTIISLLTWRKKSA